MAFQKGDVRAKLDSRHFTLRLTISALAEISERLCAPSPRALAHRLRGLTIEQARTLLNCVSGPDAGEDLEALSDADIRTLLPDICRVFERAFEIPKDTI